MSLPKLQWAQVVEEAGGPVIYKQIPVPTPGPDEVLVNIKYTGVCHTDLHARKGDWPLPVKMPLVGGHEGAGVVVAKGQLVNNVNIGDHAGVKWLNGSCLSCEFCRTSDESLCPDASLSGYTVDGTFQQFCIAKAAHVSILPKDAPLDAVAPVLCAGITVYKGLKESGIQPGQTLAIVGAGGGLGSLAQQYAKAMGLRVIAIDGGEEKKELCQQLGAEVTISSPFLALNARNLLTFLFSLRLSPTSTSPSLRTSLRTSRPPPPTVSVLTLLSCWLSPKFHSNRPPPTSAPVVSSSLLVCLQVPSLRLLSSAPLSA